MTSTHQRHPSRSKRAAAGTSLLALGLAAALTASPAAFAETTIWADEAGRSVTLGAGLRTSFTAVEDGASNESSYSKDFEVDSIRLYLNGQLLPYLGFTFNTERDAGGSIELLDLLVRFEPHDLFNVWGGRLLPPTDRSNLSGPYFLGAWTFPIVQAYPSEFVGRDDGIAVWGQVNGGAFKYQVGAFEGFNRRVTSFDAEGQPNLDVDGNVVSANPNSSDNLLYAGRLTMNLWDPEPGYYNASTYYGAKDILAIGLTGQYQKDATGVLEADGGFSDKGDFTAWSVDFLMERALSDGGVVTLEAAYYDYDYDGIPDPDFGFEGDGYFVLGSYMFPQVVGIGQFQPQVRYQELDDDNGPKRERLEGGLNYIMNGYNAKASLVAGRDKERSGGSSNNFFIVGVQLQM